MINAEERLLTNSPSVLALFAGESIPGRAAAAGPRCDLAILVHGPGRKAPGLVVEAPVPRGLRAYDSSAKRTDALRSSGRLQPDLTDER